MIKIATLGPSGTNSEKATKYYAQNLLKEKISIQFFEDIEKGFSDLLESKCKYLILPSVYPSLSEQIFKNIHTIEMIDSFIHETFPLVIAKKKETNIQDVQSVSLVEATNALIEKDGKFSKKMKKIFKQSNPIAAAACKNGESDLVVTNLISAQKQNLQIITNFSSIKMNWIVFALLKD